MPVDPYLLTNGLTDDAIVAFHSAVQFHGKAHTVHHRYHYLTRLRRRPFSFRGREFIAVVDRTAPRKGVKESGVVEEFHAGRTVRVTNLERTLVDLMVHPQYGGGWEEVIRSMDSVEFFNIDRVVEHAVASGNATAIARVGFDLRELRSMLLPTLSRGAAPEGVTPESWGESLVAECRELLGQVLPLSEDETAFVEALNERGEVLPGLLTDDSAVAARLQNHPMMRWKAVNVRKHRGLPDLARDEP